MYLIAEHVSFHMVKTLFKHSFLEDKIWRFENVYTTKVGILLQNTPCDYLPNAAIMLRSAR